ncbi:pseudouridine synthase RluA family [Clostridium sp. CAG:508]|jgi:23S rRNA pseudouridine1911/1915/1917 synthase|nr:pseudouridine synthase RluA family [Clostridium sp. CAG:508]
MRLAYVNSSKYSNVKEVLKAEFSMSDRLLLKLKKLDKIYLNGNVTSVNHPVLENNLIECYLDYEEDNSNIVPTEMPLNIIYEDEAYIVVNKPAGIPVHPSMDHYTDSLSNGIAFYFNQIGLKKKIRPVNRLDKDTSGIVIFAKNEYIQECLVRQMKSKEFIKKYIAVVNGNLDNLEGTINAPIARKEGSIIERCVSETGDIAITHYKVLKRKTDFDIVECILETGRTHQIRVHFAYLGHSLLSDTLYGTSSSLINRQALHAYKVEFTHPLSKKKVKYIATVPEDLNKLMENA